MRTPVKVGGVSDVFERAFVARSEIEPPFKSRLDVIDMPSLSISLEDVAGV
jgi:hypothetical protein